MNVRTVKIGHFFRQISGGTPKSGNPDYWDGDIPWITPADLGNRSNRFIARGDRNISEAGISDCSATFAPSGAIIVSIRAPIGHLAIASNPIAFNQGCRGLVPARSVDSGFAYWALSSRVEAMEAAGRGTTFNEIAWSKLRDIRIPLPNDADQRAIAAFLDAETARVDALIEKKERLAKVLDERLGAFLDAMTFDDPRFMSHRRRFRWICRAAEGQVDPTVEPWSTMPLVAPNHIESRTGRLSAVETAEDQNAISGKYAFQKGAVLYSKIRPALAKACIAPFDGLCSADMYPLIPTRDILPDFLLMQLLSRSFTEWAILESNRVAMPKLNRETLGSAIMVVPPIEEQRVSVERFQGERGKMDRLMTPIRGSIARLREFRSALITAAVNGQIDPNAWRRRGDTDRRLDRIEVDMAVEAAE